MMSDFLHFDLDRQQHFRRNVSRFVVELRQELGHDLSSVFVFRAFQHEILAPDQLALANEEDLHTGIAVGAREGQHVLIVLSWSR